MMLGYGGGYVNNTITRLANPPASRPTGPWMTTLATRSPSSVMAPPGWLVAVATEPQLGGEPPGMNEDRAASGREVASRSGDRRLVAPEWPPAFGRLAG